MRPRHQRGQILKHGSNWVLRYHEDRMSPDGNVRRVRTMAPLGSYADYPYKETESDIERLREKFHEKIIEILSLVNRDTAATGTLSLGYFIERSYFPRLDWRLNVAPGNELHIEPSTVKGYRDIWKNHIENNSIANIRIREFTSRDGQRFLESLPQHLAHQTHLRIKNFLRGVFTWAIADGAFVGRNPMEETKPGGQTKKDDVHAHLTESERRRKRKIQASNEHAYTLEEVAEMLDRLPEPARTVCAVAAFTGLTRSELRGLKWGDYDGKTISVRRKVWEGYVGPPKTEAREAGIFVILLLRKILEKYKSSHPSLGDGWIFRGEKLLRPLNLDNLSRKDIPQHIKGGWFGWHAFRRGLGTRLNEAGVDDKEIQSILRHADISTTQAYYILPNRDRAEAGLKKLGAVARKKYGIKG